MGPVNIGTGIETDVVEIFEQLRSAAGQTVEAVHGPAKVGEQRRSSLDTRLASQVLGWKPEVALAEGLRRTAAYYRESAAS